MNLSEAEIQVLATLRGAEVESGSTHRAVLEKRGERYWIYLEDWSGAFASLIDRGLIDGTEEGYRLTEAGNPLAYEYHRERPDMYWYYYQRFYSAANASPAHKSFCRRVYGEDLCQEGMTDMSSLDDLISHLQLKPGDLVLDLGCGAGGISEYMSDRTGAIVTGIDYSASAIATANSRTENKRSDLNFLQADMNSLELPAQSFDAAISLDSIYWVDDVAQTLSQVASAIRPGGQIGIFIAQILEEDSPRDASEATNTSVASALSDLDMDFKAHDHTAMFRGFWPSAKAAAVALRDEFDAEGNRFICENWIREADDEYLPALNAGDLRRYLYLVRL
jgi:2-polyprenyl-3-methyl-5-hydroxy-6-metoxy-1,4-benzoquinol methylase